MVRGKHVKIIKAGNLWRYKMNKVVLRGPILTQSGYGEHTRFVYRALKSYPDLFDVYVEPTVWGKTSWVWEDDDERREIDRDIAKLRPFIQDGGIPEIAILVTIPNEWQRLAPLTVGVTAGIESDLVSPEWIVAAEAHVDRIIVPSNFSKTHYAGSEYSGKDEKTGAAAFLKLTKDVYVVNYPVKKYELKELNLDLKHDFNFLTIAQAGPRKNIQNTIKVFIEEFHDDEVGLVLKINKAGNSFIDRMLTEKELKEFLDNYPKRKCKIYLLHGFLTENEIHSLYHHPKIKAIINFGHGEGFGLPLFEAAYCGLPIITHDWGGQTDFLHMPKKGKSGKEKKRAFYSMVAYDLRQIQKEAVWKGVLQEDSKWAFVNEQSCKNMMREVLEQYPRYLGQSKKLKKWILNNFAEDDKNREMIEAIFGGLSLDIFDEDEFDEDLLGDIASQTLI
jgi:glycosyltransferase involved in cell wall biosynthesis